MTVLSISHFFQQYSTNQNDTLILGRDGYVSLDSPYPLNLLVHGPPPLGGVEGDENDLEVEEEEGATVEKRGACPSTS